MKFLKRYRGMERLWGEVIFTRTRIGPIDGKGHCVEYARIFLHEKQVNRPGESVCRRYFYVCIKTPQLQLASSLRANQGIHRVEHQNARSGKPPFGCSMGYIVADNVLTLYAHDCYSNVSKKLRKTALKRIPQW